MPSETPRAARSLFAGLIIGAALAGCREHASGSSASAASSASATDATALRFPSERLSYTPLPGWKDRREEMAQRFTDPQAGARFKHPQDGEIFHLDAPLGSGMVAIDLVSIETQPGADPLVALQAMSAAQHDALAKARLSYELVLPPRSIPAPQGIVAGEMVERWEMGVRNARWQRDAVRVFIRGGRGYLLRCVWKDDRGDAPPEAREALEGLRFDG